MKIKNIVTWLAGWLLFSGLLLAVPVSAQSGLDASPPDEVIKLIFIHHSVGENWLADDYGGLAAALQDNNYFVSDTNYGWGPDGIGDRTDTLDWPEWFIGADSQRYLTALYEESDANAGGYEYYSRSLSDPGGENQIVVFKSCFPNSDLGGSPDDAAAPADWLTVASAKYTYNQLLDYFATRPDKLFVVVTSPPMQQISQPENARAFNNWLVSDWLAENDYPYHNVVVFDLYNVLTSPDNHHRTIDGTIEHTTNAGHSTLYYDSAGDDHPSAAGSRKATEEFVPLLNVYYHIWQAEMSGGQPPEISPAPTAAGEVQPVSPAGELHAGLIDDFEGAALPGTDGWMAYWDEAVETTLSCQPTNSVLQIDFDVLPQSWASCELLFDSPQNWQGDGFSFNLQSTNASQPYHILFYYQQGDELGTAAIRLTAPPDSAGQWAQVQVSWEEFAQQDSLVYPEAARGIAFIIEGEDNQGYAGTLRIDDLRWGSADIKSQQNAGQQNAAPTGLVEQDHSGQGDPAEQAEPAAQSRPARLPVCGSLPLVGLLVFAGYFSRRRRFEK